jgi:hypothetical protein
VTEESFGSRLRRERERRQIALSSISANTKISATLFEALEREDLSRWPTGIFRRAFIRAYATGIGLDPDVVQREFLERFPDPADASPGATDSALSAPVESGETVLRLTLGDAGAPFNSGKLLVDMRRRRVRRRRRDGHCPHGLHRVRPVLGAARRGDARLLPRGDPSPRQYTGSLSLGAWREPPLHAIDRRRRPRKGDEVCRRVSRAVQPDRAVAAPAAAVAVGAAMRCWDW